jgi:hypothetical protein
MKRILAIRDKKKLKKTDTLRSLDWGVLSIAFSFLAKKSPKSDKGFEPTLGNQGSQSKVFA